MRPGVRIYPVIGPPGAGKTTALVSLADEHQWLARFGVRDYGLELAEAGHPLGLLVRDSLIRGDLLPNSLVREEFTHFLDRLPGDARVVAVEGYPRDLAQSADFVDAVRAAGGVVAGLLVVEVPDGMVWARVADRRICALCGRPVAAATVERCLTCGGPVTKRGDDAQDRLARRLKDYRQLSAQVGAYFAERQLLHSVDGSGGAADVRRALHTLLLPE